MLAVAIAFTAVAQENKDTKGKKGEMGQRRGPENVKRQGVIGGVNGVKLSDAQKQQMKEANESFKTQMQELNKNENITVKEQREKRTALAQQHKANVDKILTAEQKKELEEKRKDFKEKAKDHKKGGAMARGGTRQHGGDKLAQLNLTEAQSAKIKTINEEFRTKVQNIQKNTSLSNDQKKVQREIAQTNHTEAIKAVLTTEQKQKLEALKASRPERKARK